MNDAGGLLDPLILNGLLQPMMGGRNILHCNKPVAMQHKGPDPY